MATRIDTVDARSRLKPRAEPYWTRVNAGCQIGFRKMTSTSIGTWIAKFRDADDGRREKRSLGDFDHLPPSQRLDAAKAAAEDWFKHLRKGGTGGKVALRRFHSMILDEALVVVGAQVPRAPRLVGHAAVHRTACFLSACQTPGSCRTSAPMQPQYKRSVRQCCDVPAVQTGASGTASLSIAMLKLSLALVCALGIRAKLPRIRATTRSRSRLRNCGGRRGSCRLYPAYRSYGSPPV